VPATLPGYVGALGEPIDGLKIGVLAEGFNSPGAEPDVDSVVRAALGVIESIGARLESVSVPLHRTATLALAPLFLEGARAGYDTNFAGSFGTGFYPASFMNFFGRAKRSQSHELPLNLKLVLIAGSYAHERCNGRLFAKAQNMRPPIAAQYREAFRRVDLLAMPTCPTKAYSYQAPADYADAIDRTLFGGELGKDISVLGANTMPFNYTGFPALSIPCGKSAGLPVALQLVAPHFREDLLIRVAHAYQREVDWESFYP